MHPSKRLITHLVCSAAILLLSGTCHAQRDWAWIFGDKMLMNFPGGGPPVPNSTTQTVRCFEMGACIADTSGNLQMYANHNYIYSGQHQTISNVHSDETYTQGALILPTYDPDRHYLFNLSDACSQSVLCLRTTLYNAKLNNEQGGVEFIDDAVVWDDTTGTRLEERLSAVRHVNGKDWWIYVHTRNQSWFIRWLVRDLDILGPYYQSIGSSHSGGLHAIGEMCFSPQGDRLALASLGGLVDIFDVDRCTGLLSNWRALGAPATSYPGDNAHYGCAFSPDGSKLYVSEIANSPGSRVLQWDLDASDLAASRTVVALGPAGTEFGQLQLGPDSKVYMTQLSQGVGIPDPSNMALSVINSPDSAGIACQFAYASLPLGRPATTYHLPNLPNYSLGPALAAVAEAGPSRKVCPGDSVRIGTPLAPPPGTSFLWSGPGLSDPTDPAPMAAPAQDTWYTLTATDSAYGLPCGITTDSVLIEVADTSEFATAHAGTDTALCPGSAILLGAAPRPGTTYLWSPPSAVLHPDSAWTPALPFQPGTSITLTLQASVQGITGACATDADTVTLTAYPTADPLPPAFAGPDTAICLGDTAPLGTTAAPQGWAWQWTGQHLSASDQPYTTATPTSNGTFTYTLTAGDSASAGRCASATDTVTVKVEQPFTHTLPAILSPSPAHNSASICPSSCATIGTQPAQGISYLWTPATHLASPNSPITTLLAPPSPATLSYTLTATSDTMRSQNCKTLRLPLTIEVAPCPWPSVPAHGGTLSFGPRATPLHLTLWDAAGRLVLSDPDYRNNLSAAALSPGIYIYHAQEQGACPSQWTGKWVVPR